MSNKQIIREGTAFNGNVVIVEYSLFDMGNRYKVRFKKPDECGFRFAASFGTAGEALRYFDKMVTGGKA